MAMLTSFKNLFVIRQGIHGTENTLFTALPFSDCVYQKYINMRIVHLENFRTLVKHFFFSDVYKHVY